MAPKAFPLSFANESFFAVSAVHFTNAAGETQFGRMRIRPVAGNQYLTPQLLQNSEDRPPVRGNLAGFKQL
jgi:catalase